MTKKIRLYAGKSLVYSLYCIFLASKRFVFTRASISKTFPFCFCILVLYPAASTSQSFCGIHNLAFSSGEDLNFKVVYNWGPLWLASAEASFKVRSGKYDGKKCYIFNGSGRTYERYDWFFTVRDDFESYVDSTSFRPLTFRANIHEGSKKDRHLYIFDAARRKAYTIINYGNKPVKVDTLQVSACSIDVLSAIYFARNVDYSKCKVNDTIGISLLLDGKLFPLYVRYLGREIFTSQELGTFRCIKFRPLLVEGSIFKKGEHMNVWVTDDQNKLPIYIETSIVVGSIKVSLVNFKGLRHPMAAKIN